MAKNLCTDLTRIALMVIAACGAMLEPSAWGQVSVIVIAGIAGVMLCKPGPSDAHDLLPIPISRKSGAIWLSLFFALLFGLPLLAGLTADRSVAMIDAFYRTGALVFGGGHVVLPLLQAEVVPPGWVSNETFLAGYGAVQAVPGPLFTFAAFLGASTNQTPSGWTGGLLCLLAIFAPSFLLIAGVLPFWERLRRSVRTRAALAGINAAVVGLLLTALYDPVWTNAIFTLQDFGLALAALIALMFWRLPAWLVVIGSGVVGGMMNTTL
jgi:chromate transporter